MNKYYATAFSSFVGLDFKEYVFDTLDDCVRLYDSLKNNFPDVIVHVVQTLDDGCDHVIATFGYGE